MCRVPENFNSCQTVDDISYVFTDKGSRRELITLYFIMQYEIL